MIKNKKKNNSYKEWTAIGFSFIVTSIVSISHTVNSAMHYKLIEAKTDISYSDYLAYIRTNIIYTNRIFFCAKSIINKRIFQ